MSTLNETQNKFAYSKDIELIVEHYISNTISWSCYDNYCEQGSVYWNLDVFSVARILVASRSKTWIYGRSLAGIAGSNPVGGLW